MFINAGITTISKALPLTYPIQGEQAVFAGDIAGIVLPSLILTGFTLLSLGLAVYTFRWDPYAPILRHLST